MLNLEYNFIDLNYNLKQKYLFTKFFRRYFFIIFLSWIFLIHWYFKISLKKKYIDYQYYLYLLLKTQ